jgi:hypothetical protein
MKFGPNLTKATATNSSYPKGGVSCSKDSFVVNETFVLLINICGESPALRVAAKRWLLFTVLVCSYHF